MVQESLTTASVSALAWNYTGTAVHAISSLALGIVLARILGPEPFGLLAVGMLVVGLGRLISELGLSSAMVQRKTISDDDIRSAFSIQLCTGMGLMTSIGLSAPLIAHFFDQSQAIPVVRAMSLVFLFHTFGAIAAALLTRTLDFKTLQVAQISSYLIGFLALGVPLALFGFGVWSLVVAQLFQAALYSIICYRQVRHPLRPLFKLPPSVLTFGYKVLLTNLVNWTITNLPTVLIGRVFDVFVLGLYNRAYILVTTPVENLVVTVQRVTFSAYSRKQNDPQTIRRSYLAGVGFMTLVTLPAYGSAALVPDTIIHGLFGNSWNAAIPLIVPLALAMPFQALMALGGPMLWAQNCVEREFRAQLFTAILFFIVLLVTARISVLAVAWGILGVSILRFVLVTHACLNTLGTRWSTLLSSTSGGMVLAIFTAAIVFFCDQAFAAWHSSTFLRLVFDAVGGAGFVFMAVLLVPKLILSREMCWLCECIAGQMPAAIGSFMRKVVPLIPASIPR